MKSKLFLSFGFVMLISIYTMAQNLSKVKGWVKDAGSQRPIYDVNVSIKGTHKGTTTDSLGYFQLELPSNYSYTIIFSCINYGAIKRKLYIKKNEAIELNIKLKFKPIKMPEVSITGKKSFDLERSLFTIDQAALKKAGGKDLEKALKYLCPGILYKDWSQDRFSLKNNIYNNSKPNFTLYVNDKLMDSSDLGEINIDEIKYIRVWGKGYGVDYAPIDLPLVEGYYVMLIVTK